jgi:hypothetical protein
MTDDEINPEDQEEETQAPSEEQVQAFVREFGTRIERGEFDDGSFHRVVEKEVYPLLGAGALDQDDFSKLVLMWAERNNPYNWARKFQKN